MGPTLANTGKWREPPSVLELPNGGGGGEQTNRKTNRETQKMAVVYFSTKSLQVNDMSRLKPSSFTSHLGCCMCMKRNLQLMQLLSLGTWWDRWPGCNALPPSDPASSGAHGDTARDLQLAILRYRLVQQREILRAELNIDYSSSFTAACNPSGDLSWDIAVRSRTAPRLDLISREPGKFQSFFSFLGWFGKTN